MVTNVANIRSLLTPEWRQLRVWEFFYLKIRPLLLAHLWRTLGVPERPGSVGREDIVVSDGRHPKI